MTGQIDHILDPQVAEELLALGGGDFLAELVGQFVGDTEPLLVELHEAFDAGDAGAVARIGHRIKGGASQMGGQRLAASSSRLERGAIDGAGDLGSARAGLQTVETEFEALREAWTTRLRSVD